MDSDLKEAAAGCEDEVSGGISVLSEDLLNEVLLHLPPSSLLSSTCVSKSWLRLCSSPVFRLSYKSSRVDSFLGFFVNFPCRSPFFFPSRSLSSSSSAAVADLGSVQILDSRGGWLLLRDLVTTSLRLFHPIINETLAVAPTSPEIPIASFCVLLPDPFSNPLRSFRIIRVLTKPSSPPLIEVFSSEFPGEWKRIQSSFLIRSQRCFAELHPVLVNGFLHWLNGGREIISLDETTCDLSILGLPRVLPLYLTHRLLGKLNDRLSYAYVEETTLYIWVLVDRIFSEWYLEHQIDMAGFREFAHARHIRPIAFGGGWSSPILFLGWMERIFSLDLYNRGVRELCNAGFEVDHVFPLQFNGG
ncbi:hypothetical protein KSP40_PGU020188 [Platanthera guangdongensis]|uniref:F-box domain-containing protein n=1 Tax=Platanthera guangdongensis TaxID=2320717 RepID=A0ABR2MFL7_9ASPA